MIKKVIPLCPATKGASGTTRPTLASRITRKAPPPPDSTITTNTYTTTTQRFQSAVHFIKGQILELSTN